jgi:hypothetical protein
MNGGAPAPGEVGCPAGAVGCDWRGEGEALPEHTASCWFHQGADVLAALKARSDVAADEVTQLTSRLTTLEDEQRVLELSVRTRAGGPGAGRVENTYRGLAPPSYWKLTLALLALLVGTAVIPEESLRARTHAATAIRVAASVVSPGTILWRRWYSTQALWRY